AAGRLVQCVQQPHGPPPSSTRTSARSRRELSWSTSWCGSSACCTGSRSSRTVSTEQNSLEFINLAGFDARSMVYLDECHDACEVVLQWLQRLIVEANSSDVIKIAPPILARRATSSGRASSS
ncbi:unnamed protein product, partial [Prorocentrum cordatum]